MECAIDASLTLRYTVNIPATRSLSTDTLIEVVLLDQRGAGRSKPYVLATPIRHRSDACAGPHHWNITLLGI